jgi:hypothetical protein
MPKDDIKLIKLDPLAEKLDRVGFKGGASRRPKKLSKEAKKAIRQATKDELRYSKEVSKAGRRGDFGSPMMSRSAAKELKTGAKESRLDMDRTSLALASNFGKNKLTKEMLKGRDEARKFLKKKKVQYRKDAKFFQKRGMNTGGLIKGFPKLAKRGY